MTISQPALYQPSRLDAILVSLVEYSHLRRSPSTPSPLCRVHLLKVVIAAIVEMFAISSLFWMTRHDLGDLEGTSHRQPFISASEILRDGNTFPDISQTVPQPGHPFSAYTHRLCSSSELNGKFPFGVVSSAKQDVLPLITSALTFAFLLFLFISSLHSGVAGKYR